MFSAGDTVSYGADGICKIEGITEMTVGKVKKHFHISDEKYLREAERLLHDEFSYTLNISNEEVPAYILKRIKK